ncbi:hypothetical protein [Nocardia sp. NBC_01009]|uniref:hypothetical protein n=1 Tax=Nocardia sp. NBC_01009 TaxID=2975996 RepID=UPI00386AC59D|nr:polyketide synthase dehydratase domain-containing protein [Nocardia sp. NBC_01009]
MNGEPDDGEFAEMAPAPRLPSASRVGATPHEKVRAGPNGTLADAIVESHATTTALHERFLHSQADFHDTLCRWLERPQARPPITERILDPAALPWLADHCPDGRVPVLPGTAIADLLAGAAAARTGCAVTGLRAVTFRDRITVAEPVGLRTEVGGQPREPFVTLSVRRASRYTPVATGYVLFDAHLRPVRFAPLADARPAPDPYTAGTLFHGPCMRYLQSVHANAFGASGALDCGRGNVPPGTLHHGLLDAAMHTIAALPAAGDRFLFPYRMDSLALFGELPTTGIVEVEARAAGQHDQLDLPVFDLQLCCGPTVLAALRMVFTGAGPRGRE